MRRALITVAAFAAFGAAAILSAGRTQKFAPGELMVLGRDAFHRLPRSP
ncbi:MAG: hypothetical protein ACRD1B_11965 [Thermoanaerobaculia bacterium]